MGSWTNMRFWMYPREVSQPILPISTSIEFDDTAVLLPVTLLVSSRWIHTSNSSFCMLQSKDRMKTSNMWKHWVALNWCDGAIVRLVQWVDTWSKNGKHPETNRPRNIMWKRRKIKGNQNIENQRHSLRQRVPRSSVALLRRWKIL